MPGRMRDPGPSVTALTALSAHESPPSEPGRRGSRATPPRPDESWTEAALRARAAEQGIKGRSRMRKRELIEALRGP